MGTFVQPNLAIVSNNNNSINNNNNNTNNIKKPTITVVQTPNGFREVKVEEDSVDIPMVVDEAKLQQQRQLHQTGLNISSQLAESPNKSISENCQSNSVEINRRIKSEDGKVSSPSSPSFIDINSLPMVFDDTKLFQNVSIIYFYNSFFLVLRS